jgi:hypothetical protein
LRSSFGHCSFLPPDDFIYIMGLRKSCSAEMLLWQTLRSKSCIRAARKQEFHMFLPGARASTPATVTISLTYRLSR